ncbi:MAG TPA: phosphatase PAP2 family protein [Acidimicrobiales bacterium]|nr:phosphatase PAP2 family protein [Acidimicrobiales bacterium]
MTRTSEDGPSRAVGPTALAVGEDRPGLKTWLQRVRAWAARERSPLVVELLFIAWLCWLYDDINSLSPLRISFAYRNGWRIFDFEQRLHLDPEASFDHWLAGHPAIGWLASLYYDNAHFIIPIVLVGVAWWKFPDRYRPLRNGMVLTNLFAMVIFWLVPTAPPRLLDPSIYTDIVSQSHAFGSSHTGTLATAANQLAAMPSLHIGWAAWSSLVAWRILPRRWWTGLVWLYPVMTSIVVMATGNHFLADVVAGAVVFAVAQIIADGWAGWWTAREARRALERGEIDVEVAEPADGAAALASATDSGEDVRTKNDLRTKKEPIGAPVLPATDAGQA